MPVPRNVLEDIREWIERYGLLRIERTGGRASSSSRATPDALEEVLGHDQIAKRWSKSDPTDASGSALSTAARSSRR